MPDEIGQPLHKDAIMQTLVAGLRQVLPHGLAVAV
jgi:hypothetical protein